MLSTPPFDFRTIHAPYTTARNSHVVTSRTAQTNLSRFQHRLTQTFPVCQRHQVFLRTRVHDHIQQDSSDSSDGRSELSQTDMERPDGIPEMSQTDSAHTCCISLSSSGSAGSSSTARALAFPPEDRHIWLKCPRLPQRLQFSFRREQSGLR